MVNYKLLNINPKNKKTDDCVIRAITLATGKDYKEVYTDLFNLSLKTGYMLNEKRNFEKHLEQCGFTKIKQPRKLDNTKYLVSEINEITKAKTIIVSMANHLTCIKDGTLYDLWDCRDKCISNYYIKGAE